MSRPAVPGFIAREERFGLVGSTNDVVRGWLADGTPEVCLAIADEQTAGRGRDGRTWVAPTGVGLLLSLGFRPDWLAAEHAWRLAAIVSLAMAEAAEAAAGVPGGTVRLKWPNDLAVGDGSPLKLAGVLGETDGLGTDRPTAVIGIGVNVNWSPADFPPDLAGTMTSLRALAGRDIDPDALLTGFLLRLEALVRAARRGSFDGNLWAARQLTTGREVELVSPDGARSAVLALGVDADTGALLVESPADPGAPRAVIVGEIQHVRLADPIAAEV